VNIRKQQNQPVDFMVHHYYFSRR